MNLLQSKTFFFVLAVKRILDHCSKEWIQNSESWLNNICVFYQIKTNQGSGAGPALDEFDGPMKPDMQSLLPFSNLLHYYDWISSSSDLIQREKE